MGLGVLERGLISVEACMVENRNISGYLGVIHGYVRICGGLGIFLQ